MNLTNLKYVQVPMVVLLDEDFSSTSKPINGLNNNFINERWILLCK